jgi:hypothetical protein
MATLLWERRAMVFIAGGAAGFTIGLIACHGVDRTCAARLPTGRFSLDVLLLEPVTDAGASLPSAHRRQL